MHCSLEIGYYTFITKKRVLHKFHRRVKMIVDLHQFHNKRTKIMFLAIQNPRDCEIKWGKIFSGF